MEQEKVSGERVKFYIAFWQVKGKFGDRHYPRLAGWGWQ